MEGGENQLQTKIKYIPVQVLIQFVFQILINGPFHGSLVYSDYCHMQHCFSVCICTMLNAIFTPTVLVAGSSQSLYT